MKRTALLTALLYMLIVPFSKAQLADSADVYLLTCAPGTEVYSIYGHTAIRINIRGTEFDRVYNWGVFDFSTPNFAFRFAKGKLDYMLGAYGYEDFLNEYKKEGRSVWSQKVNLNPEEKEKLFSLINENLKPENIRYRYDFFYDNCATRVRDILENSIEDSLAYFPKTLRRDTFRQLINPFQQALPWIDLGADLLLGLQADRMASLEDEMFLPMYLQENISSGKILRLKVYPVHLLDKPVTVVDFTQKDKLKDNHLIPQLVMYGILIFIILVTFVFGMPILSKIADVIVYIAYSVFALLLIFTNIFSEHAALHYNMLIIAVNPIIPCLLVCTLSGKKAVTLHKIALVLGILFFPVALIAGQGINPAIIPLVLILLVRIFKHCEFGKSF